MSYFSWLLDSPLVYRLGSGLVHFLWQGAVVAAVLSASLRLLRLRSANTRYVASWLALVAMATCVLVTLWVTDVPPSVPDSAADVEAMGLSEPLWQDPEGPAVGRSQDVLTADADERDVDVWNAGERYEAETVLGTPAQGPTSGEDPSSGDLRQWWSWALPWIVGGWLVGAIGLSLWRLGGWLQLRRLCHVETSAASHDTIQVFKRLLERLCVSRPIRLLESTLARGPIVIGWLRPVVLLPVAIVAELPPQQLEMILAHELAHIRRWDFLWNLVQTVIETLLFYHPAVWWVSRQIRLEREACCDDMAARVMGDRLLYAQSLASLEEMRHQRKRHLGSSLQVAADDEALLGRIRRVLGLPNEGCRAGHGWFGGILAVSFVVAALAGYMAIAVEPTNPSEETVRIETEEGTPLSKTQLPADAARTLQAYLQSVAEADGKTLRDMLCFVDERDEELFFAFSPKDDEHFARLGIFHSEKVHESKKASEDCWLVVLENNRLLELWQTGGKWRVLCPMPGHLRMAQGKLTREEGLRHLRTQEMQRVQTESETKLERRRARYLALLDLKSRYGIGNLFMYYSGIPAEDAAELSAMSVSDFRDAVMLKLDAPSGLRYCVEPNREVFDEGQSVVVTFVLDNTTKQTLKVPYRPVVEIVDFSNAITARGAMVFPKGTEIEGTDENRSPYRGKRCHPFEERVVTIEPRKAVRLRVDLRDYYDLPPARYTISAHLMVEGDEQGSLWRGQARTDTIGFAVQAPSEQEATGGESETGKTRSAMVQKFAGIVTDEQGKPLEGVTVKMCGVERFHDGRWHRNCRPDCMVPRPTTSDKTGRFAVEFTETCFEMPIDERKTRFNLWFSKGGYAPTYLPGISPKPQETKVILRRGTRVSGTVKRQTEGHLTPIQGAVVYLQCSSGDRAHQERVFDEPYFFLLKRKEGEEGCDLPYQQRVVTDADGRYTVTLSPPPKGKRWFLVCSDEGWHKDSAWRGPKLVKGVILDVKEGQPVQLPDFVVDVEVSDTANGEDKRSSLQADLDGRLSRLSAAVEKAFEDVGLSEEDVKAVLAVQAPPQKLWKPFGEAWPAIREARAKAAREMADLGPDVVPLLLKAKDESWGGENRGDLFVDAIEKIGKAAAPQTTEAPSDQDRQVRARAISALGRIGDARAVDSLIRLLDDPDAGIVRSSVWALGRLSDNRATDPLLRIWGKDQFRREIALALGTIGDKRAVEPIMSELDEHVVEAQRTGNWHHEDMTMRSYIGALRQLGDPRAVPLLKRLLEAGAHPQRTKAGAKYLLAEAAADALRAFGFQVAGDVNEGGYRIVAEPDELE